MTGTEPVEAGTSLRERQKRRARGDLVRATLDVIERAGLEGATIERITRHTGASRATLYAHFPGGRSEVVGAAYQAIADDLIAEAERDAAAHDDWVERVVASQRAMLRLARRRRLSEFYNIDGPHLFALGRRRGSGSQRTLDAIAATLRDAQEHGRVDAALDTSAIAALLVGAIRETGIDATRTPSSATAHTRAFRQLLAALATNG